MMKFTPAEDELPAEHPLTGFHPDIDWNSNEYLNIHLPQKLADSGELVLHASSVLINNKVIGFAGLSGVGKSTLARRLCEEGCTLFSDESLILRVSDPMVHCYSYPHNLRLWEGHKKRSLMRSKEYGPYALAIIFLLHTEPARAELDLLLESTYKSQTANAQLDLRLLTTYKTMKEQGLLQSQLYLKDSHSMLSMQELIKTIE